MWDKGGVKNIWILLDKHLTMFRESDDRKPRPHPTYVNRKVPEFQFQSRESKLIPITENHHAQSRAYDPQPNQVPLAQDRYYDPTHPMTDWGGWVSKKHGQQKIHRQDHSSQQIGIENTEYGIISREAKKEFPERRRADESLVTTTKATYTFGGVGRVDDDRWKTNYKSLTSQEKTTKDQMTFAKRQGTRRPLNDPAACKPGAYFDPTTGGFNSARGYAEPEGTLGREEHYSDQNYEHGLDTGRSGYSNASVRTGGPSVSGRGRGGSMLSNIGSDLADIIKEEMPKSKIASEIDARSLLSQNYKPLPGYTGTKRY